MIAVLSMTKNYAFKDEVLGTVSLTHVFNLFLTLFTRHTLFMCGTCGPIQGTARGKQVSGLGRYLHGEGTGSNVRRVPSQGFSGGGLR